MCEMFLAALENLFVYDLISPNLHTNRAAL